MLKSPKSMMDVQAPAWNFFWNHFWQIIISLNLNVYHIEMVYNFILQ